MLNHYVILGLNETGLNDKGLSYSESEISKAYKIAAPKYHPDKTKIDSGDLFNQLNQSYELLMDPDKRAIFDNELKNNPLAFKGDEHLIIVLPADNNVFGGQGVSPTDNSCKELSRNVTPMYTTIDLTQCLLNANCSTERIMDFASQHRDIAKAILKNPKTLSLLSIAQQFELLFIACAPFANVEKEKKEENTIDDLLSIPSVEFLIKQVTDENDTYQLAFINACIQRKEMAQSFFKLLPDFLNKLTLHNLVELGVHFEEVAYFLIKVKERCHRLRPITFVMLVDKHENLSKLALGNANEQQRLYYNLARVIKGSDDPFEIAKIHYEDIIILGVEAFSLSRLIGGSKRKERGIFSAENQLQNAILMILILQPTAEKFIEKSPDIEELLKNFLSFFLTRQTLFDDKKGTYLSLPGNKSVTFMLLERFDANLFSIFVSGIKFNCYDPSDRKDLLDYVLLSKERNKSVPYFFELLEKKDEAAWTCLGNNRESVVFILNNIKYIKLSESNSILQERLVHLCQFHAISPEEIAWENLPAHFKSHFEMLKAFSFYLQKESPEIDYEIFSDLFTKTGFFPDLMQLKTVDLRVQLTLIIHFVNQNRSEVEDIPFDYHWNLKKWTGHLLESANEKQVAELLAVMKGEYAQFVLDYLEVGRHGPDKMAWKILHSIASNEEWMEKYVTAGRLVSFIESATESATSAKFQSDYVSTTEHPSIVAKVSAYRQLEKMLQNIQRNDISYSHNADAYLISLYEVLKKTGLDKDTLQLIERSLAKDPLILSALLQFILEKGEIYLTADLKKEIGILRSNLSSLVNQPLEFVFLSIAKDHIDKYRDNISGDHLVTMAETFGPGILPTINEYGLKIKLINAQKLIQIVSETNVDDIKLENCTKNEEETTNSLLGRFYNLASLPYDASLNEEALGFYAELLATAKQMKQSRPLEHLINACPEILDDEVDILLWLFNLIRKGDEKAKDLLVIQLANEHAFAHIKNHIMTLLDENEIIFSDLEKIILPEQLNLLIKQIIDEIDGGPFPNGVQDYLLAKLTVPGCSLKRLAECYGLADQDNLIKSFLISLNKGGSLPTVIKNEVLTRLQADVHTLEDIDRLYGKINRGFFIFHVFNDLGDKEPVPAVFETIFHHLIMHGSIDTLDKMDQLYGANIRNKLVLSFLNKLNVNDPLPPSISHYMRARLSDRTFTIETLDEEYGKANTNKLILKMLTDTLPKQQVPQAVKDYFLQHLLNGSLTLDVIDEHYGISNRDKLVWHILADLDLKDALPASIQQYIFGKGSVFTEISVSKDLIELLDEHYGETIRNKLIHLYLRKMDCSFEWPSDNQKVSEEVLCQSVLAGRLNLNDLPSMDGNKVAMLSPLSSYLNSEHIRDYLSDHSKEIHLFDDGKFKLTADTMDFYPLYELDILQEIIYLSPDSGEYQLYKELFAQADWNSIDVNQLKERVTFIHNFFQTNKGAYFNQNLFGPIQQEIERLHEDTGFLLLRSDGKAKEEQMKTAQRRVLTTFLDKVDHNNLNFNQHVNTALFEVTDAISKEKFINSKRNKIAAFFKSLCGVLISLPVGCAPIFCSSRYHSFFFKTSSRKVLDDVTVSLKP